MKFTELEKLYLGGELTAERLESDCVEPSDFMLMREALGFDTVSFADKPAPIRDRTYKFVFVTESPIGHFMDVPLADGWQLQTYRARKSPVLLFHEGDNFPVGRAGNVLKNQDYKGFLALMGNVEFAPREIYPMAGLANDLVSAGFLNGGSVGFNIRKMRAPSEKEVKKWKLKKYSAIFEEMDLVEYSVLPVGRDPHAGVIYGEGGADKFEQFVAAHPNRYEADVVQEFRERALCTPSTKSFHAIRSWMETGGNEEVRRVSDEGSALSVGLANTAQIARVSDELAELRATVQELSGRVVSPDSETKEEEWDVERLISGFESYCQAKA